MIIKILALVLVLSAIYFIFFKKSRSEDDKNLSKKDRKKMSDDVMIDCVKCGTYVSNKEAFIKDGSFYCSKECVEA